MSKYRSIRSSKPSSLCGEKLNFSAFPSVGSVLKWSRALCGVHLGNLTKHHPSQDATLAEVARRHKWRHLVTQVFLLVQSWSAAGRPRSTGHALSLARVMVMVEGGTRVDGFFLPHKAFTPFRLLEPSSQVTPCDITSHPLLHPAAGGKRFQGRGSVGSLYPALTLQCTFLSIHLANHSPTLSFMHLCL